MLRGDVIFTDERVVLASNCGEARDEKDVVDTKFLMIQDRKKINCSVYFF